MIYSLTGQLTHKDSGTVVIRCGGVGYRCLVPLSTAAALPAKGAEVTLYTHLNVREDAMELFGFSALQELECFKMLISVSGVGPRVGLSILTHLTADNIRLAIATGDTKALTKAQGVGPKLAQRLVLELKDKMGAVETRDSDILPLGMDDAPATPTGEAVSALAALGYSRSEAATAVAKQDQSLSVEELIKGSLRVLMRG